MKKSLPNGPDAWADQNIMFCNHAGYFQGDMIVTPFAVTILAGAPITPDRLRRTKLDEAQWRISDAYGGYWNPMKGKFVLPREAVTQI